jgi:hypothetical protein
VPSDEFHDKEPTAVGADVGVVSKEMPFTASKVPLSLIVTVLF